MSKRGLFAALAASALLLASCGGDDDEKDSGNSGGGDKPAATATETASLSGEITLDGSSTVGPFAQAAAELFMEENPDVKITVGVSGTGGGFERFCAGETDISNASRPISEEDEVPVCAKNGIEYTEIQVANDGVAIASNKDLAVKCLKVDQLKKLWNAGSKVKTLAEIDPSLPKTELSLYGPGTDSGTFDFFTDMINGEEGVQREDYEASEDDNQLVTGVTGDAGGLGYFGFSYYEANADNMNLIEVDGGDGCVAPSAETIQDGSYKPLSRPIFMYPSNEAIKRPEVAAFMTFVADQAVEIADAAKMVSLTEEQIQQVRDAVAAAEGA